MSFAGQELSWRQFLSRQCPFSRRTDSRRRPRPAAVGRRGGSPRARAEPRHPDRAAEPGDSGSRHRAARGAWVPSLLTSLNRTSTASAPTNPFAGGLNRITDTRLETPAGRHPGAADRRRLHGRAGTARGSRRATSSRPTIRSCSRACRSTTRSRCSATSRSTTSGSSSRSTARSARTATRRCSRPSRRPRAT